MSTAAVTRRAAPTAATDADSPGAQLRRRWRALAPRERSAVRAVLWLLGALAVWLIGVQPAWRTLREAPAQMAQAEAQLQRMQRLADEAKGLRGASPVSASQAAAALRAATERLGGGARLTIQGERATLILPAATAGAGFGAAGGAFGNAGGGPAASAGNPGAGGGLPTGLGVAGATGAPGTGGTANGGVSGDALRSWLSEARSAARARPIEVQLTRGGGGFSGSVVVLIGAGNGAGPAP